MSTMTHFKNIKVTLQQYLPFTVLKPTTAMITVTNTFFVATVLTVYGIETNW